MTIGDTDIDGLDGEYRLEQLPDGDILLHPTSHQHRSTDCNNYSSLRSDVAIQVLQTSILEVIEHRCEGE